MLSVQTEKEFKKVEHFKTPISSKISHNIVNNMLKIILDIFELQKNMIFYVFHCCS